MAVIQIPNLPAAIGLTGAEQLEAVQGGTSVKITTGQIAALVSSIQYSAVPVTKTANFSLAATDMIVINNNASSCVVTMLDAASYVGKVVTFINYQAVTLNSGSSSSGFGIVPITGGSAGTSILPATDGAWATVASNGTNWVIISQG
jgi:hypothetical protein